MSEIDCRPLTLRQARRLPPIPSDFTTEQVYRLASEERGDGWIWSMVAENLAQPYHKSYDLGLVDDWLHSYRDEAPRETIRFIGAFASDECVGLLTWRLMDWNRTVWLMDMRVRQGWKRQGVGSSLVETLVQDVTALGARGILVETQTNNYPAIRFYRRAGFRPSGLNDHLYTNHDQQDGEVAVYLFRETERFRL